MTEKTKDYTNDYIKMARQQQETVSDMKKILGHIFTEQGDAFSYIDWFVKDEHPRMKCGSNHYNREYKRHFEKKTKYRFYLESDPKKAAEYAPIAQAASRAFADDVLKTDETWDADQYARFIGHYAPMLEDAGFGTLAEAYMAGVPMADLLA